MPPDLRWILLKKAPDNDEENTSWPLCIRSTQRYAQAYNLAEKGSQSRSDESCVPPPLVTIYSANISPPFPLYSPSFPLRLAYSFWEVYRSRLKSWQTVIQTYMGVGSSSGVPGGARPIQKYSRIRHS